METMALLRNLNRRAFGQPRVPGFILGALVMGVQACGDGNGVTEPTPTPTPTLAGDFTLSAAPVSVLQGGEGESKIAIVRSGGFTGNVTLAVTGAPAGLTAKVDSSAITGTTATLTVTTVAGVTAGSATLTITGTAAGRPVQTTTATVAITPNIGGTGNVSVDFSTCEASSKPIWFAFQDGTGAWTQILGSADVYRFNVVSAEGGYAWVRASSPFGATVSLATRAELALATILPCGAQSTLKSVSGTLAGLGTGDVAYVGIGGGGNADDHHGGPVTTTSFTLTGIMDGIQDLIAYRSNPRAIGTNERVLIRRDQNIPNNGSLGTIDFAAAESFAPSMATLTVTGAGSESTSHGMAYHAGGGCSYYGLYDDPSNGGNFMMRGIPAAQQRATDFHRVSVGSASGDRFVNESFHALASRVVALPAALPAPTITAPPGGHKRIQASLTLPSEYQSSLYLSYFEQGGRSASMSASFGWLGGTSVTLALPDFSGVTGWRSAFLPASGASVRWYMAASGANSEAAGGPCAENARFVVAYVGGTGSI